MGWVNARMASPFADVVRTRQAEFSPGRSSVFRMFNVCPGCGQYRPDREIRVVDAVAVCGCGDVQAFRPGPLFVVGGASGTGKSTILNKVGRRVLPVLPLDGDILWDERFRDRVDQYVDVVLRLAKNIGMAGKPVMVFAAGLVVPENLETSVERRYFSTIHRLALVCDDHELTTRLRARPAWRGASEPDVLAAQLDFNRGLTRLSATEDIALVDTTSISVDDAAEQVIGWMQRHT